MSSDHDRRPVLALGRHAGTEVAGGGASPGTSYLFASLEEHIERHFEVVRIPPYYYSADPETALRIAIDLVGRVDACLLALPPTPWDLDPLLVVRERLKPQMPVVYMPLGEFPRGAGFYRNVFRRLTSRDLVLFSSTSDLRVYERLVRASPAFTAVVPFGIEPERFEGSATERERIRLHLGLDPQHVVFVYHGRVDPEKNVQDVISMFGRIARERPHARLWIIGEIDGIPRPRTGPNPVGNLADGPLTRAFERLTARDGSEAQVFFWGPLAREAIPAILGAADVAVSLTVNGDENFGYGVVEAMAAGLPVIGTDWGGLRDTIAHGSSGFLVDTATTPFGINVDLWRAGEYARKLADGAELRRTLGESAVLRVRNAFTASRFAANVAQQVTRLLRARARAGPEIERHEWSPLGRRIVQRYSRPLDGSPDVRIPVSLGPSPVMLQENPLMQLVVAPYGTRRRGGRPRDGDVLFLCSDLLTLEGTRLRCDDPRRPSSWGPLSADDAALIRRLQQRRFATTAELFELTSRSSEARRGQAALQRLLHGGIVMCSTSKER